MSPSPNGVVMEQENMDLLKVATWSKVRRVAGLCEGQSPSAIWLPSPLL